MILKVYSLELILDVIKMNLKFRKSKRDHIYLEKDIKQNKEKLRRCQKNHLQGIDGIKDDFKQKQVKDVNQVKSSVNQMANNLEDHTIELS